jgi:hypothetical protein
MAAAGAHTVLTMLNSPAGRFAFTQPGDAPGEGTGSGSGTPAGGGDSQGNAAAGDAAAGQQEAVLAGSAAGGREAFESYLERVAQTGVVPLQMPLFCAHQMGTCRLGELPSSFFFFLPFPLCPSLCAARTGLSLLACHPLLQSKGWVYWLGAAVCFPVPLVFLTLLQPLVLLAACPPHPGSCVEPQH